MDYVTLGTVTHHVTLSHIALDTIDSIDPILTLWATVQPTSS